MFRAMSIYDREPLEYVNWKPLLQCADTLNLAVLAGAPEFGRSCRAGVLGK